MQKLKKEESKLMKTDESRYGKLVNTVEHSQPHNYMMTLLNVKKPEPYNTFRHVFPAEMLCLKA